MKHAPIDGVVLQQTRRKMSGGLNARRRAARHSRSLVKPWAGAAAIPRTDGDWYLPTPDEFILVGEEGFQDWVFKNDNLM